MKFNIGNTFIIKNSVYIIIEIDKQLNKYMLQCLCGISQGQILVANINRFDKMANPVDLGISINMDIVEDEDRIYIKQEGLSR